METMLLLLFVVVAIMAFAPARPEPVKVRRNPLQEDLLAHYINERQNRR